MATVNIYGNSCSTCVSIYGASLHFNTLVSIHFHAGATDTKPTVQPEVTVCMCVCERNRHSTLVPIGGSTSDVTYQTYIEREIRKPERAWGKTKLF